MGVMNMGGKRRQYKADDDPNPHRDHKAHRQRKASHCQKLGDDRRKAGAVKGDVDIAVHGGFVVFCIQENACKDGPDIQKILAKQGKAEHQTA